MPQQLKHIFVLMLENRSFDHMFGFSGLSGTDAATGAPTLINGLSGHETNVYNGTSYPVLRGAGYIMPADPGHVFLNVLDQLCGAAAHYPPGAPYPPITNAGFVDSYNHSGGAANLAEIMQCFDTPRQLPVVFTLAREFALCDRWYASMPGPTWPNRMFAHAASSGGLDHSPTTAEIVEWETIDGFTFPHGSLYDQLQGKNIPYHFYAGDHFPLVAALKHVTLGDIHDLDALKEDLQTTPFPYGYVFIEPSYNALHDYRNSSCQHPLADVRQGEALIKDVYESLRNAPAWEHSLLIITWDEHGGFFDHVAPPPAKAPGDTSPHAKYNQYGFTFTQYGPRVPALIVSPFVARNVIDHRVYDHASIPATVEALFGLSHLTERDASANTVLPLLTLDAPREDAPLSLPAPVAMPLLATAAVPEPTAAIGAGPVSVARPDESVNRGNLPSILHAALHLDLATSPAEQRSQILAKVAGLQTRADAMEYLRAVQAKIAGVRVQGP